MSIRVSEFQMPVANDRVRRTLSTAALILPLCGCALNDAYTQCESNEFAAPNGDPMFASASAWGGVPGPGGFATPTWSETASVFGAPAWGPAPSIYGSRLHVPPGESVAAKVLTLTDQLAASKSENEQLADRIRVLETDIESGNKALARASSEVIETRTELANARNDLEKWKRELTTMREKLEAADKDNLSTLQSTVGLLQQLLAQPAADAE